MISNRSAAVLRRPPTFVYESHANRGAELRVVHSSHGRLRVRLPLWTGRGERQLQTHLLQRPGVRSAEANALTQCVLLVFDPGRTSAQSLLTELKTLRVMTKAPELLATEREPPPRVVSEGKGEERRIRIAVRGVDRNSAFSREVVQMLRQSGVRAWAKPITGHIVVEYNQYQHVVKELMAMVARVELPALPGEDRPDHPLDPFPLRQGLVRAIGGAVGLGIITYRRLQQPVAPLSAGHGWAETIAGIVNLVHGIPVVRKQVDRYVGKHAADLILDAIGIASLTIAGFSLGLIVTAVEALLLVGEVTARRSAWLRYEDALESSSAVDPGSVVRLEAGAMVPLSAQVIEGNGTAIDRDGLPLSLRPGDQVPAGAILSGGPFVLEIADGYVFEPRPRPAKLPLTVYDRYRRVGGTLSTAYVAFTALRTFSLTRTFESLLLLNPRPAAIAEKTANLAAAARALRSGITVTGTRVDRPIRFPSVVLFDGPRLLTDGLEINEVFPASEVLQPAEVLTIAATVSAATGSPWGNVFPKAAAATISGAEFNGLWATAVVDGYRYSLGPPEDVTRIPESFWAEHTLDGSDYFLELRNDEDDLFFGLISLRPRITAHTAQLVQVARRLGVRLELLCHASTPAAKALARRSGMRIVISRNSVEEIRERQRRGAIVAFVSDHAGAAEAFAACDLAIGLGRSRTGEFPARADVLAPDLCGVADLLDTGWRREKALRDGVHLSATANLVGAALGLLPGGLGTERASTTVYLAAIAAMGAVLFRLRGGVRPESSLARLADPRPERWAQRSIADLCAALHTSEDGLSMMEAANRRQSRGALTPRDHLLIALRNQLKSPITLVLTGGACLTLVLGQPLNTALLAITSSLNVAAGVWQEREVGRAAEAIKRLSSGIARVLRDERTVVVPTAEVVAGDVLLLGPGDRVAADARMIHSEGLEVNEAALTGESLPVSKGPEEFTDIGRIVLEGSDIVVGTGRAIVIAVGAQTRLGATAAALNVGRGDHSPMAQRLSQILRIALPLSGAGGLVAGVSGLFFGGTFTGQLAIAVTTALSAIPEGLPLLAGVGQAGVANRLASKNALVRRIAAVEALGRVDVACTDKTGTMTEGRLALRLIADMATEIEASEIAAAKPMPDSLRHTLLTAALASPNPKGRDAVSHPTDLAVVRAAIAAGMEDQVTTPRLKETGFDSARAYHAAVVPGRICVKGAPEKLLPRCTHVRVPGYGDPPIDGDRHAALHARVVHFAERGLRVLLVAEGPETTPTDGPQGLTAIGFVAISDPLRPSVPEAVRRCQLAGIRVIMLTGDHPATARAIAQEAGLLVPGHREVLRAADLAELTSDELDRRLEGVAVIARAAPLDKLRVIESLKRRGHVVAMTGDGVNDAPSLRLADVGVAMGQGGTEVARQAADVVLMDDDFATLVEALVEGRGFWRNMRTGLGLLLGGNAGELGVIVAASLVGFGSPFTTAQILLINLITDTLPALAVVLQKPKNRDLAALAREGLSALDSGLRRDVVRRGLATSIPTFGSYLFMQSLGNPVQANSVAFASVVATQLAQTLDVGWVQGTMSRSVRNAVGVSGAVLLSTLMLPGLRGFFGLMPPSLFGWGVVGVSSASAVVLSRLIRELAALPTDKRSEEDQALAESNPSTSLAVVPAS
jgi:calcium-translocating P-type ATPase